MGCSFGVFFVSRSTKLYETGHCFAEFQSFREIENNTKIRKKCFELFRETCETMLRLVFRIFSFKFCAYSSIFCTFHSCIVPFIGISFILFKCRTFYSSFVPFFDRGARAFMIYLHSSILPCVLRSRPIVSLHPPSPLSTHTLRTLSPHTLTHTIKTHTYHTHSTHSLTPHTA